MGGSRPLLWPTLSTIIVVALCLGLGVWQIQRLAWKENLIAQRHAAAIAAPIALPRGLAEARRLEFRHVAVEGVFLNDKAILAAAISPAGEAGYYVLTPLREAKGREAKGREAKGREAKGREAKGREAKGREAKGREIDGRAADSPIIFVNRGFVPGSHRDEARRLVGEVAGRVRVAGLLRVPPGKKPGFFIPDNDPARGVWFWIDLPAMTAADRLAHVAPFYIDADATPNPGGWPKGGITDLTLPNHHLQYIITWFSLAAAMVVIYFLYYRRHLGSR